MKYDYLRAITDDVKDWIREETNFPKDELLDRISLCDSLWEELFNIDDITGNGMYYYADEDSCAMYISENFDLIYEAAADFGPDNATLIDRYECHELARYFDCTIRCYLLMDAIYQAIDELAAEGFLKLKGDIYD